MSAAVIACVNFLARASRAGACFSKRPPMAEEKPGEDPSMKIEQASEGVGALVTGVDVSEMSGEEWDRLYQAWLDHCVLIIRDQHVDIEQFLDHGRRFGRVKPHLVRRSRHQDYPELTVMGIGTRRPDGSIDKSIYNRGGSWHTDGPWDQDGCKATQLYAREIPSYGGDTLFANMYMAYAALPDRLKHRIEGLEADYVYGGAERRGSDLLEPADRDLPPVRHPLVGIHPETGRPSLYFNAHHILGIVGLSQEEGQALIEELKEHQIAPDAVYRHAWHVGDLITWDNRCTLHAATGGYPIEEPRIHWRCTIVQ
jgi:taurine dioxygenase